MPEPTDDSSRTYFLVAKELPVAVAMDDVTFAEAMAVAGNCAANGQVLVGPDDGPEGYVVNFDLVAGFRVTPKPPSGPAMVMPRALVAKLLQDADDEGNLEPDDKSGDALIAFLRAHLVIGHKDASAEQFEDLAARRLIVDECESVGRCGDLAPGTVALADKVLRLLTLPLADREGYSESWKL